MPKSLPVRIVKFYRGWRDYVAARKSWEASRWIMINDLSSLPEPADKFSSHEELLSRLTELIDESDRESETYARLKQSAYFLTQTNESDLRLAIEARGISVAKINENIVDELYAELKEHCYWVCGDPLAWKNGHSTFTRSVPAPEAARLISESGRSWLRLLQNQFKWVAPPKFASRVVEGEKSWVNMVTTEDQNIELVVNQGTSFAPSHIELLALHEIGGHVFHFNQVLHSQFMQEQSPDLCCFTIHNQDAYLIEGIAMFMAYALTKRYSPEPSLATIGRLRFDLWLAIRHSIMLELIDGKITLDQAIEKHAYYMGEHEMLREHYQATMKSSLFAIQGLCYIPPYLLLRPAADLNDKDFSSFLEQLLTQYHSPSSLHNLMGRFRCL